LPESFIFQDECGRAMLMVRSLVLVERDHVCSRLARAAKFDDFDY